MDIALLLIVLGIILAVLVNYGLGILLILVGVVLAIWPYIAARR